MEIAEYHLMAEAEDRMWWYQAVRTNLVEAYRGWPGVKDKPLLDAGCGTGGQLARIGEEDPSRLRLGIDFEPIAARYASQKSRAPVAVASVNELPFADASLGGILSVDVICHRMVDPDRALAEAKRCLAPGGTLIANLPAYQWMLSSHDRRVHNSRRFTASSARQLFAEAGFVVREIRFWNALLFPVMLLHRTLFDKNEDKSDVTAYPKLLEWLFGAIMRIELALTRIGLCFPFGGSILVVAEKENKE
jgi:SAM-dependent methyltransferase